MEPAPTYALYGESERTDPRYADREFIAARSARFDWEIRPHRHREFFQILHIARGGRLAVLQDRETPLVPPVAAATIPAPAVHGFRFSRDVEGSIVMLRPTAPNASCWRARRCGRRCFARASRRSATTRRPARWWRAGSPPRRANTTAARRAARN